jgi:uncharacterized membrane protein
MAAKNNSTTTGLAANLASALCYAPFVGWVVAIVLFLVEKNTTVKWNAVQALLVRVVMLVLGLVVPMTIVLLPLVFPLWVAGLILDLVLTVKAYQSAIKLPVLADWTDKILKKV